MLLLIPRILEHRRVPDIITPIQLCLYACWLASPPFIPLHPLLCLVNMLNPEHIKLGTNHPDPKSSTLYPWGIRAQDVL